MEMPFDFERSATPGVLVIYASAVADDRGRFSETYRASVFAAAGIINPLVLDNASWSAKRGGIRGLHRQRPPFAHGKLVRCLRSNVRDLFIDLRSRSPGVGRWVAFKLSVASGDKVCLPPGLAHRFRTRDDDSLITYTTSAEYSPVRKAGIHWDDGTFAIERPMRPAMLSPRDAALPSVADAFGAFNDVTS